MRVSVLALGIAGCGFHTASTTAIADEAGVMALPDAAELDAPPVDSTQPSGEPVCIGTYVTVCVDPPTTSPAFTSGTLDTGMSAMCVPYTSPQHVDACVISGSSITIPTGTTITVVGSKRLILASTGSITIA